MAGSLPPMVEPDANDPALGTPVSNPDEQDAGIGMADGAAPTAPGEVHAAPTSAHGEAGAATRAPEDEPADSPHAHPMDAPGARLVVKRNGAETDEVFPITSPATIGRFDPAVGPIDVDLGPLPEGAYVSRKHARLTEEDGQWTITDLGSSNGTFVLKDGDFAREESAPLADNVEFALGNARFVLKLS